ncbi:MAG: CehA/McbA family metallohydrolase [bacterium]
MDIAFDPLYLALYPEIHYTFDLFFSRLWHSQPEIVVDCPFRIDPGKAVPLLCIIKHANRFPITLHSIWVEILYEDGAREEKMVWNTPVQIKTYLWYKIFRLQPREPYAGDVQITAHLRIERGGRFYRIANHNYRGVARSPLTVRIAREPLPALENWYYGEPHCHSFHSDDQVEFGAPVPATAQMAEAMGLAWLAVTDHSYDLDDMYSNALHQDRKLLKWNILKEEIKKGNANCNCCLILGEEISCGNARHKNVHLLAYGIEDFIPGGGDGAERWLRTRPDLSLREVLKRVKADGAIAYASHPEERFTLGERLMLRRGHWGKRDYELPDYIGLQFWNGKQDKPFREGYKRWVQMLLRGRRVFFLGGNDSHGDFNIFRQVRVPLLRTVDSSHRVFGKVRTCLYCKQGLSGEAALYALRNGNSIVSSGPFVTFSAENEQGEWAGIGGEISGKTVSITIKAKSTSEFGDIERITICQGEMKEKIEKRRELRIGSDFYDPNEVAIEGLSLQVSDPLYLRLEVVSRRGEEVYRAYTNPIWLNPA